MEASVMISLDHLLVLSSVFFILFSSFVDGRLVNITVDDTNPDPLTGATFTYLPASGWNVGNGCQSCTVQPDPSLTFDATWHDATYADPPAVPAEDVVQTASFPFSGSAFYVYGILSHSISSPRSTADLSFFIDGQLSGTFTYAPPDPGESTYTYNALLYANDSIAPGLHSFTLQNGNTGGIVSLVLLDYIIYTNSEDDATPPLSSSILANSSPEPSDNFPISSSSATITISFPSNAASVTSAPDPTPSISSLVIDTSSSSASTPVTTSPTSTSFDSSSSLYSILSSLIPTSAASLSPSALADLPPRAQGLDRRTVVIACVVTVTLLLIIVVLSILYVRHRRTHVRHQRQLLIDKNEAQREVVFSDGLAAEGPMPVAHHDDDETDLDALFPASQAPQAALVVAPTNLNGPSEPSQSSTGSQPLSTWSSTDGSKAASKGSSARMIPEESAVRMSWDSAGSPPPAYDTLSTAQRGSVQTTRSYFGTPHTQVSYV